MILLFIRDFFKQVSVHSRLFLVHHASKLVLLNHVCVFAKRNVDIFHLVLLIFTNLNELLPSLFGKILLLLIVVVILLEHLFYKHLVLVLFVSYFLLFLLNLSVQDASDFLVLFVLFFLLLKVLQSSLFISCETLVNIIFFLLLNHFFVFISIDRVAHPVHDLHNLVFTCLYLLVPQLNRCKLSCLDLFNHFLSCFFVFGLLLKSLLLLDFVLLDNQPCSLSFFLLFSSKVTFFSLNFDIQLFDMVSLLFLCLALIFALFQRGFHQYFVSHRLRRKCFLLQVFSMLLLKLEAFFRLQNHSAIYLFVILSKFVFKFFLKQYLLIKHLFDLLLFAPVIILLLLLSFASQDVTILINLTPLVRTYVRWDVFHYIFSCSQHLVWNVPL